MNPKIDKLQDELDSLQANSSRNGKTGKFLLALKELVEENDTFYTFSKKIDIKRGSLYKTLSERGNPRLSTLLTIVKALNLKIKVVPKLER